MLTHEYVPRNKKKLHLLLLLLLRYMQFSVVLLYSINIFFLLKLLLPFFFLKNRLMQYMFLFMVWYIFCNSIYYTNDINDHVYFATTTVNKKILLNFAAFPTRARD